MPRKGIFRKRKGCNSDDLLLCQSQDIFQANSPANFAEGLRFFANMELRVGNATFGKFIGIRGNWVKAHCRRRDEKIKETGTIVPEDDYLNAMDQ